MRRDRRRQVRPGRGYVVHRFFGRDVLKHDAQFGQPSPQPVEHPVDKHRLAVEHVDLRVGHLAVDQQRHAEPCHAFEHRRDSVVIDDAKGRIGRCPCRVELDRREHPFFIAPGDLFRLGSVGQITGHQRREIATQRESSADALAVRIRRRDIGHRRYQVWHYDRAGELPGGERQDRGKHYPVTQMDVPIVGAP